MSFAERRPANAGDHGALGELIVRGNENVRGTQSFVHIMAAVWRRPLLTLVEVAWRWVFGSVALYWIFAASSRIWTVATLGTNDPATLGLAQLTLLDPMATADRLGVAWVALAAPVAHAALRVAPVLAVLWIVVATLGRSAITRMLDRTARPRLLTLAVLNLLRLAAMALLLGAWIASLLLAEHFAVARPIARNAEPNLVGYFALVITATLVLFLAWSAVSWLLRLAPLLAQTQDLGVGESLLRAARPGRQGGDARSKLFEINLVMGIVKVALIVLALVFSATPLPFESFTTAGFLTAWWIAGSLLYCIASDYFHVVHASAFLALWREYDGR